MGGSELRDLRHFRWLPVAAGGCGWLPVANSEPPIFDNPSVDSATKLGRMICKNAPDQSCRSIFDNPSITFGRKYGNAAEPQVTKNGPADDGR